MNTTTQSPIFPGWARTLVAVITAIVVFRICRLAADFIFFWTRNIGFLFPIDNFLQRWDYVLVTGFSLISAVLVSRWAERKFTDMRRPGAVVAAVTLTIVALLPIE